jgi:hypothetical protein
MLVKMIIILLLLFVLASLASGLVFLVKDEGHTNRTVKALTWRIALSLVAFVVLVVGYLTGLIQPHGLYY